MSYRAIIRNLFLVLAAVDGLVAARARAGDEPAGTQATFYVATDGSDAWSGKLAAANAQRTDGPFATLEKARDALRAIDRKGRTTPLVVMVRGGKYFLDDTLVIGPKDAGTAEAPVVYTAYPGEKPILSGGRKMTGWQPYKAQIFVCDLPGSKGGKWKFRRLWADGKLQCRSRWPNFDPRNPVRDGWAKAEGPAAPDSQQAFRYRPGTFPRHWAKPTEGEVNIFYGNFDCFWGNDVVPIKSIDETKRIITLTRPTRDFDRPSWFWATPFQVDAPFIVENLLEELDQPGEWCMDSEEGKLYYWPPSGSIEGLEIVAPKLGRLVALHRTGFVTIRGFTFTETTDGDEPQPGGVEGLGAMFSMSGLKYSGEALHLNRAQRCLIEDNHFDSVGGNAVYLQGYNARNIIRGNEIDHAGANGVCLGGAMGYGDFLTERGSLVHHNVERRDKQGRAVVFDEGMNLTNSHPQFPLFNEVIENHIHHTGEINAFTAGVFLALSEDNVVGHNSIHDLPSHAVELGSSGQSRNIIEYNDIRRTCQWADDTGAINCWADAQPRKAARQGHIIRYNRIVESRGHGVYLDDYTSNCFVYGNVIIRPGEMGIHIHGGKNNVVENNLFIGVQNLLAYDDAVSGRTPEMAGYSHGNRFCRNICVDCREKVLHRFTDWNERTVAQSDENLFFNVADAPSYLDIHRKLGFESHSVIADPLFVDPAHDDYRLKAGSPALKLGFQPIDFSRIGPPPK